MRGVKILEFSVLGVWVLPVILLWTSGISAQKGNRINLLEFKYGFHVPSGDLGDRFGSNSDIGLTIQSVHAESRLFFGIEGMYMFGNNVKEDVLSGLRTFDGTIIGIDGLPGDINLKERGYYVGVNAGKIFPTTSNKNKLTGIRAQIGAGFLQHKIRVQDNAETIPALSKKYLQGYDRLTNGPAIRLGLGYHYQSPTNNFQFHIMGDLYGAQTESRRDYDYPTGQYLDQKRTEVLGGLSLAYVVSISRASKPDNIYY
jgi:hypothetical protein